MRTTAEFVRSTALVISGGLFGTGVGAFLAVTFSPHPLSALLLGICGSLAGMATGMWIDSVLSETGGWCGIGIHKWRVRIVEYPAQFVEDGLRLGMPVGASPVFRRCESCGKEYRVSR